MAKKRYFLLTFLFTVLSGHVRSQESSSIFNFLNLPVSAHTTALGGRNISLVEDDLTLTMQNPALLTGVSDKTAATTFMSYMQGVKAGTVSYSQHAGWRGAWGAHVQFVGYGSTKETLADGEAIGEFKPLDVCMSGQYSYILSEHWAGGVTGKMIYSHYASYTSFALATDLGINYFNEDNGVSLSAVARNLGGQIKAFGNERDRLPFSLELGFSQRLGHAPIRISVTMVDLTRWKSSDYYSTEGDVNKGRIFTNHFVLGAEFVPTNRYYIAAGFNFRRAFEMKAAGSSHAAGLSFGAGLNLKRIKLGVAYAKYHISAPTLAFTLAYIFQKEE